MIILLTVIEFLCGSLMFSYWLGFAVKKDLRTVGDNNPGAFNLWHAAGYKLGLLGILLDFTKGYLPLVFLIHTGIISSMAIVPVAIAPIFGHAFSPFMKFKGGKSIAVTFGVWSAVSNFEVSLAFAIILAVLTVAAKLLNWGKPTTTEADAFMVVTGMTILGIYLYVRAFSLPFMVLWIINLMLFVYVNRLKLFKLFRTASVKINEKYD